MLQQALFRINQSNFLIGFNYIFSKTTVTAFEDSKLPQVDELDFKMTNSGLSLIGEYETFNNILSPSKLTIPSNLTFTNRGKLWPKCNDTGVSVTITIAITITITSPSTGL